MAEMTALVVAPHPLTTQGRQVLDYAAAPLLPGDTLAAFVGRHGVRANGQWVVLLGGVEVPQRMWDRVRPKQGHLVEARRVAQGDDAADLMKLAAVVALSYYTMGMGGMAGASGSFLTLTGAAGYVAAGVAYVGGSMVINKLMPPASTTKASQGNMVSPTYSLNGGRNQARMFEPMGLVLGEPYCVPDLAAQPYAYYAEGEQYLWQVLHGGLNCDSVNTIRIGQTAIESYQGVNLYREGFASGNTGLPVLSSSVDMVSGALLDAPTGNGPVVLRTGSVDTIRLAVDLEGQLSKVNTQNGGYEITSCTIALEYRMVGADAWLPFVGSSREVVLRNGVMGTRTVTETGEDGQPYEVQQTYVVTPPTGKPLRQTLERDVALAQYEVRAQKISANPTSTSEAATITWSMLKSYQADTGDYRGQARLGLKVLASGQLSGSLDQVNWMARAKPMPYWNGSAWVTATTRETGLSNPGALILLLARGIYDASGRLVAGMGYADAQIDLESLKLFMVRCAAKGFTFDYFVQETTSVGELLDTIAAAGMGVISWHPGTLSVVWYSESDPVEGVLNMATMKAKSFSVSYDTQATAEEIEYQYFDRNRGNAWKSVRVQAPTAATVTGTSRHKLVGVTTEAHAAVMARFAMAQNTYQRKSVGVEVDLEHLNFHRGTVMAVSHDVTQWGYGGRLRSAVFRQAVTGDPLFFSVVALLHFDGEHRSTRIVDSSPAGLQWSAVGDARISTNAGRFGPSSLRLSGASYARPTSMVVADPYFNLGAGDFTVEGQFMPDSLSGIQVIFARGNATGAALVVQLNGGVPEVYCRSVGGTETWIKSDFMNFLLMGDSGWEDVFSSAEALDLWLEPITVGAWSHIKVARSSGVISVSIDNKKVMGGNFPYALNFAADAVFALGAWVQDNVASQFFVGSVAEFRLTQDAARDSGLQTAAWPDSQTSTPEGMQLTLDDVVPAVSPTGSVIRNIGLRLSGERQYRVFAIKAFTGSSRVVTLNTAWPDGVVLPGSTADNPAWDAVWIYDFKATPGQKLRVAEVSPTGDCEGAQLMLVPETDEFWDYVWNGTYRAPPSSSLLDASLSVLDAVVTEKLLEKDGLFYKELTLDFTVRGSFERAELWGAVNGGALVQLGATRGQTFAWNAGVTDSWALEVRCFGLRSTATPYQFTYTMPSLEDVLGLGVALAQNGLQVTWAQATGKGYKETEIRKGESWDLGTLVTRKSSTSHLLDWQSMGTLKLWAKHFDAQGKASVNATGATLEILGPRAVQINRFDVEANTLALGWADAKGSQPIKSYGIYSGSAGDPLAACPLYGKAGADSRSDVVIFRSAGAKRVYVVAQDVAGNTGAPASTDVTVRLPTNFVLSTEWDADWTGTKSNAYVEGTALVLPVDTTETWDAHFASRGWANTDAQVAAGLPLVFQPGLTSGSYVELHDVGKVLPRATIRVTTQSTVLQGSVLPSVLIEWSADNSAWTAGVQGETDLQASQVRYVRVTYAMTSSGGDDLVSLAKVHVVVSSEEQAEYGELTLNPADADGTLYVGQKSFLDVVSAIATPKNSANIARINVIVDDATSTTKIYVQAWNTSNVRTGGVVSLQIGGY